jgi:hypothetical protein
MHYYAFKINQNNLQFERKKHIKKNAWFAHGSNNHKSKATKYKHGAERDKLSTMAVLTQPTDIATPANFSCSGEP